MKIKYNLKTIIEKLETLSGKTATLDDKLENTYILSNISEDDLIDEEFIKVESKDYLCYQKDNIFVCFKDNSIYVSEITIGV